MGLEEVLRICMRDAGGLLFWVRCFEVDMAKSSVSSMGNEIERQFPAGRLMTLLEGPSLPPR